MKNTAQYQHLVGVAINESAQACNISADITGYYANDVSVTADDDALIVEMISKHQPGQSYYLGELETERHVRTIPLGFQADGNSVMTHFNDGKLEILVHKTGASQSELTATAA
jgi:HSP20 family molecular chaperone IbpA